MSALPISSIVGSIVSSAASSILGGGKGGGGEAPQQEQVEEKPTANEKDTFGKRRRQARGVTGLLGNTGSRSLLGD